MKIGSILATLGFMILAAVFFVIASDMPDGSGGDVGAGFFPRVISVMMIVCGIVIIIDEWKKNSPAPFFNAYITRALLIGAITIAYIYFMGIVGFLVVTPIYIMVYLVLLKQKNMMLNVAYSIAISATVFVVFGMLLNVRLTRSFIEPLLGI
ncbi:MAG: tripartite tricarboxylate transporter TctB family protein [Defluviitaleaceae bacterium]|nr:tripartite tricarboxylate transporter TctB family protein [Defluviitaleaceae bacterium]